ncbi:MAG TPA: hypothetical protein VFH78_07700 [Candidatus Thermoplasmatota archaeon]|nr:hypothetical protein [Candidatus Thermoplasmatota archaeon]
MAQLSIHGNWKSILGLASFVAMVGVLIVSLATGESTGIWLYLLAIASMVFGFWSKEDHIAIGGIVGLNVIMILDIILRIGLLGFTECKEPAPGFSIWFGCP